MCCFNRKANTHGEDGYVLDQKLLSDGAHIAHAFEVGKRLVNPLRKLTNHRVCYRRFTEAFEPRAAVI